MPWYGWWIIFGALIFGAFAILLPIAFPPKLPGEFEEEVKEEEEEVKYVDD